MLGLNTQVGCMVCDSLKASCVMVVKLSTSQVFLTAAALLLLVGMGLAMMVLAPKSDKTAAKPIDERNLVLVTRAVQPGQAITAADIAVVPWPKPYYPDEHNVFESDEELIGRVARLELLPGEPLFKQKLAGSDAKEGFSIAIPEGMRAMTIAMNDVKGVAGLIKPGNRVDVIAQVDLDVEEQSINLARTVLQNKLVLAVEQDAVDERINAMEPLETSLKENAKASKLRGDKKDDPPEPKPPDKKGAKPKVAKNVTLAVWPHEAEKLVLAEGLGTLRLVLRNEGDVNLTTPPGTTQTKEFYAVAQTGVIPKAIQQALGTLPELPVLNEPIAAAWAPQYKVELVEGTNKQEVAF
jgi:pilus assembly protein CpaB